jgi:cell division protein FtsB
MTKYTTSGRSHLEARPRHSKFNIVGNRFRLSLVLISIVCLGALVIYLAQINSLSTKGFEMRELQKQITMLQAENEKLELQMLDMQALSSLVERARSLQLVASSDVRYISGANTALAKK